MLSVLIFTAALAAPPSTPGAPTAGSPASQHVTASAWVVKPTSKDLLRSYPRDARDRRLDGRVVLDCLVDEDETLYACKVIDELPLGRGFGEAALSLTPKFRIHPPLIDGKPVRGAHVFIPLNYRIDIPMDASLGDTLRCVGYASQMSGGSDRDAMITTWTDWYTDNARRARLTPEKAADQITASVNRAADAIKTPKGAADADACRDYYHFRKATGGGVEHDPPPDGAADGAP